MCTVCPDSGSCAARVVVARVVVAFVVVALAAVVIFVVVAAFGLGFAALGTRAAVVESVAFTSTEVADSSFSCAGVCIGAGVVDWIAAEGDADAEDAVMVAETVADEPVKPLQAESIQHSSRAAVIAANLFIPNSFNS